MMKKNLGFVLLFVENPLKSALFYKDLFEMDPIPKQLQELDFGFAKAPGLNDRKSVNISNIDRFTIVQSREISRCQNPILEVVSVYRRVPDIRHIALSNGVMLGLWNKFTAEPRVEASPGAFEICFSCNDIDSLYDEWGKKRLVILQKPTLMDFGYTFVVQDPDGHRIRAYKLQEAN
ncbi:MAG: hypothetical protein Tsb0021_01540 [Chlamydiales bacterium]